MSSKEFFFQNEYIPVLRRLNGDEKGQWGVLSPQGMIEHMTDSIGIAWSRIQLPIHTPPEMLEKYKSFAMSDKEFKPGTKNALMSEEAPLLRNPDIASAITELEIEIKSFIEYHKTHPSVIVTNPFFGDLNYEEWLHLLYKHAIHHLKQFNLI